MSVLNRKLVRELRHTAGVLAAISSIMAIGVAAYVALNSTYENLTTSQRQYYSDCRMADFSLELKKIPNADLTPLAALPGIVEIRPRIRFFTTVDLERVSEPINGLVLSLPDRRERVINDVVLRRGSYFTDRRANEVIIDESFARRQGLYPGQSVHLILNDQRQELFIVGTAISSEFTYLVGPGTMVPDAQHFGVFYIKHTFAEETFNFDGASNQVLGLLAPNVREHPQEVLRRAEAVLAPYGVFTTTPQKDQPSHRFLSNEIQGLRAFGVIDPLIFLAVASMVLNVLLSRLAEQQRVVIGTLKAVGYDDRQVFSHFLEFGLCVGLAGGLAGCLLGYWIAAGMTALYQAFFQFPNLEPRIYVQICLQGVLIGLVCGLIGSLHGARAVLRLEPAEAMRPKPPAQGGKIWIEHFSWFWNSLSFGSRMTLRNVVRNRQRTVVGIFAAAMGSCVAVNALMLAVATEHMIDFQFELVQRSDVELTFKEERGREALDEVRRLPSVDYAEPILDVACTFVNGPYSRKGGVTGILADGRLTQPRDARGHRLRIPTVGLVMNRKMASLLHLTRGDLVEVHPTKGLRQSRWIPVQEISDSYLGVAVYADLHYLSRVINEEFAMSGAQLSTQTDPVARQSLYRELKQLPKLQAVTARADTVHNVKQTLVKNLRVFIGFLVIFAGVIFFGSVLNSSLVSLAERQREVATLRVLGYGPFQVGGLFFRESLVTNILGTLAGLPLGYLLNVGVTMAYDTEMFRIPVIDPTGVCIVVTILGVVFGLIAHGLVQREILRMDWLEAVKTKE